MQIITERITQIVVTVRLTEEQARTILAGDDAPFKSQLRAALKGEHQVGDNEQSAAPRKPRQPKQEWAASAAPKVQAGKRPCGHCGRYRGHKRTCPSHPSNTSSAPVAASSD